MVLESPGLVLIDNLAAQLTATEQPAGSAGVGFDFDLAFVE
jgi:hypothetical protein